MGNIQGVLNLLHLKTLPFPILWLSGGFWLDTHHQAGVVLGNKWAVQNSPEESSAANQRERERRESTFLPQHVVNQNPFLKKNQRKARSAFRETDMRLFVATFNCTKAKMFFVAAVVVVYFLSTNTCCRVSQRTWLRKVAVQESWRVGQESV